MVNDDCFSDSFQSLWRRLVSLEQWLELAIRPDEDDKSCPDRDLLLEEIDNLPELSRRCQEVRKLINNQHLPVIESPYEQHNYLEPRTSTIPGTGLGLFTTEPLLEGAIVCYYRGHIHNFHSTKKLVDKTYLMLVQGSVLIDTGPLPHIKARYMNDPLNEAFLNCKYVSCQFWSQVVATRDIRSGEELFVSYGEAYWNQREELGRQKR
jgi:hypothetical protein